MYKSLFLIKIRIQFIYMPKISHQQRQVKQINNLLKTLMNEYSTSTNKAITKSLDKEINELLELIQAIENGSISYYMRKNN